jgi:hypothetical protein
MRKTLSLSISRGDAVVDHLGAFPHFTHRTPRHHR